MYIGAWQEYKLAQLIKQQREAEGGGGGGRAPRTPLYGGGRRPVSRAHSNPGRRDDDAASLASSRSFSGFSTQSAPAGHGEGDNAERTALRQISVETRQRAGLPPRPKAGARGGGLPGARRPAGKAAAAKAKAQQQTKNFEELRKSRIQQMQKLYGLHKDEEGGGEAAAESSSSSTAASSCAMPRQASGPALLPSPGLQYGGVPASALQPGQQALQAPMQQPVPLASSSASLLPDVSRALQELQMSMQDQPFQAAEGMSAGGLLSPLPEDPMDSSAGLIAWSKGLCPEEVSPSATLANFLPSSLA
eukprot:TRINITY_DN59765_c1_g1_i1.p1 TRINITY_DN59765_c1_g1~~TRINITY_DN59765_c1_g1_i1.p1  ORF type:complete len:305 (+),score=94.35 TRINITY_DN59765_c1_g1_i1:98-1012(+)